MTEERVQQLVLKRAAGSASEEEIQELNAWYQSVSNADVTWVSSNQNEESLVYHRMRQRLQKRIAPGRVFQLWPLKVAAAILIIVGAGFIAFWYSQTSPSYISVVNPYGKIQQVHLPDGSNVWLNASTTLRYRKEFKEYREVELEGEAFFSVTHDATHPFNVDAGGVQTTVLGTSFNIKAYNDDNSTNVSVVSGKVNVESDVTRPAVLTPAMELAFDRKQQTAQTIQIDTTAVLAWRKGKLLFDGKSFSAIAGTLERWYGVKIVFANEDMRACRYYMSFDNNLPLENILTTIAEVTETKYVINQNNTIVITGKACSNSQ